MNCNWQGKWLSSSSREACFVKGIGTSKEQKGNQKSVCSGIFFQLKFHFVIVSVLQIYLFQGLYRGYVWLLQLHLCQDEFMLSGVRRCRLKQLPLDGALSGGTNQTCICHLCSTKSGDAWVGRTFSVLSHRHKMDHKIFEDLNTLWGNAVDEHNVIVVITLKS